MAQQRRKFTLEEQRAFALLSGDANPIHTDPQFARRTARGKPLVHGIHLLLWALELADLPKMVLSNLHAEFKEAVVVGEELRCEILAEGTKRELRVYSDSTQTATFRIEGSLDFGQEPWPSINDQNPPLTRVHCLTMDELAGRQGSLELWLNAGSFRAHFPKLLEQLPKQQLAILLASSALVGNQCPGLHSLLHSLSFDFGSEMVHQDSYHWTVEESDERFSSIRLGLSGVNWKGSVQAFLRPPPVLQPSTASLAKFVPRNTFDGQRALVVGGSRGMGEVCAKLLSLGGADVILTYCTGESDAEAVVQDIRANQGKVARQHFDVLSPEQAPWNLKVSHLYYFATPPIFVASRHSFAASLFYEFCRFYVEGFVATVQGLVSGEGLRILYPSSEAVVATPRGLTEYAAAKAAGEKVCHTLMSLQSELFIHVERFPRVATDQTASIIPNNAAPAAEVLLPVLKCMHENG